MKETIGLTRNNEQNFSLLFSAAKLSPDLMETTKEHRNLDLWMWNQFFEWPKVDRENPKEKNQFFESTKNEKKNTFI